MCVQRGHLQLFDTQAIDDIGVCYYSRAHFDSLAFFASRGDVNQRHNQRFVRLSSDGVGGIRKRSLSTVLRSRHKIGLPIEASRPIFSQ
jgi:hypothetical protein